MIHRIHILGASGSGTTTLGRALATRLQCPRFDTDDYFWLPTDPPYTHQREHTERQRLLMDDLMAHDAWVVSGSLCGWLMWRFPRLSWSSFCRFPRTSEWNVSIVESMHDLELAFSLVGICTSSPKRFWRGQHPMMKEGWTCGAGNVMTGGSVHCPVPSSASKARTPSRNNLLC